MTVFDFRRKDAENVVHAMGSSEVVVRCGRKADNFNQVMLEPICYDLSRLLSGRRVAAAGT